MEKNPDNRPFMVELLEHPFFTELCGHSGSDHHVKIIHFNLLFLKANEKWITLVSRSFSNFQLSCEIKHLLSQIDVLDKIPREEISIIDGCIKKYEKKPEKMIVEDLCAMDQTTEEKISQVLKNRLEHGNSYAFAGDVLISINSNELPEKFSRTVSFIRLFSFLQKFLKRLKKSVEYFLDA